MNYVNSSFLFRNSHNRKLSDLTYKIIILLYISFAGLFTISCDPINTDNVSPEQDIREAVDNDPFEDIRKNFRNAETIPSVVTDIRYATENNFTGQNLYGDYKNCLLHPVAFGMLSNAANRLNEVRPGYKLLVFDCLRPRRIQRKLFDVVKGTEQEIYVANPDRGSVHNYGFAIDLSLMDESGNELDMGTEYDAFDSASRPDRESEYIRSGRLTQKHIQNRKLLRFVMEGSGFENISIEWWHFNALPIKEIRKKYQIVE